MPSQRGTTHRGIDCPAPAAGDANGIAPQHDQQGVPPTGNRWRGRGHGRLRYLRARPAETPGNQNATPHPQSGRHRSRPGGTQVRGWPAQCRLHLQQTRGADQEIDWRLRCGARVLVSTPREDIGASMLIAEELEPCLDVPVEVVPLEELESVFGELQQRHGGDKPLFPPTGGGDGQETRRPRCVC